MYNLLTDFTYEIMPLSPNNNCPNDFSFQFSFSSLDYVSHIGHNFDCTVFVLKNYINVKEKKIFSPFPFLF